MLPLPHRCGHPTGGTWHSPDLLSSVTRVHLSSASALSPLPWAGDGMTYAGFSLGRKGLKTPLHIQRTPRLWLQLFCFSRPSSADRTKCRQTDGPQRERPVAGVFSYTGFLWERETPIWLNLNWRRQLNFQLPTEKHLMKYSECKGEREESSSFLRGLVVWEKEQTLWGRHLGSNPSFAMY